MKNFFVVLFLSLLLNQSAYAVKVVIYQYAFTNNFTSRALSVLGLADELSLNKDGYVTMRMMSNWGPFKKDLSGLYYGQRSQVEPTDADFAIFIPKRTLDAGAPTHCYLIWGNGAEAIGTAVLNKTTTLVTVSFRSVNNINRLSAYTFTIDKLKKDTEFKKLLNQIRPR